MDQFVVSARKYRPATFDSVVGQRHISETLKNAIKSGHLAQAFLFSGPRGVGKTTCARILAKTINCFNRTDKVMACEKCDSCQSFNDGHSLNIYELDAASNNSVEDIRGLIEQVRFAPQIGTKKVYIIDEVHMLSAQAFNAFLKTLEEPPSHAIFILATTEKHKIIPTILSRCQVFDFNRIEIDDMVRHLEEIAEKEKVEAVHDALHLIAQKSDGSLRDALSMFDQMVTYSGGKLTYESVVENLSILNVDYFFRLTDFLAGGDVPSALLLFNEILIKGFDGHNFVLGFAEHLRNLLVSQDHSTIELLTTGKQIKERYREQTLQVSSEFLIKGLNLLNQADLSYKGSKNQRLLVELTLINLANLKSEPNPSPEINSGRSEKPEAGSVKKKAADNVAGEGKIENEKTTINPEGSSGPAPVSKPGKTSAESRPVEIKDHAVKADKTFSVGIVSESISIKDYMSPKRSGARDARDAADNRELRNEAISPENFQRAWNKIVEHYDKKKKMSLHSTLTKYEAKLVDGPAVEIMYDNKAQLRSINIERAFILESLRNELKNDAVELNTVMSTGEYKRAYTPAEKLEKLIENNPDINLLKEKLDLDLNL